jgi:hypothetical protein
MYYTRTLLMILMIAIGMTTILFGNLIPQIQTAGQQQTRKLKSRAWDREPVKIVAVTNKSGRAIPLGKGHLADDDWLRGLTISIKNMTNKNILFVELELHFLRSEGASDETITAFPIVFGTPPGLIAETPSPTMLPPNENWHVSLSDQEYAKLGELLANTGYPKSIKDVEIITREVLFADKTKWSEGEDRDPAKEAERQWQVQGKKKETIHASSRSALKDYSRLAH